MCLRVISAGFAKEYMRDSGPEVRVILVADALAESLSFKPLVFFMGICSVFLNVIEALRLIFV